MVLGEDLVNGNVKVIMGLKRRNKRTESSQNCEGHGLEDVVFEEEWSLKRRVLLCSSKNGANKHILFAVSIRTHYNGVRLYFLLSHIAL